MPKIILVRHGKTHYNASHRYQGQVDVPLNEEGRAQARAAADRLKSVPFTLAFASDLKRAYETATIVAAPHGLKVAPEPRIRELGFGDWEGMTFQEIQAQYPEAWSAWTTNPIAYSPPGGEPLEEMGARVSAFITDLSLLDDDQTVLVVAHGGSLRWFLCLALGVDPQRHWQFRFDSASVTELFIYGDKAVLTLFNDRHHLEA